MYGLKLYVTLEDIDNYIQNKVDPKYKDCTFIPIKAEINENDLSIDVTLISMDDVEDKDCYRYKLDLDDKPQRWLRKNAGLYEDAITLPTTYGTCFNCTCRDYDMPQCQECITDNFKHFQPRKEN